MPLFNSSISQSNRNRENGNLFTEPFLIAVLKNKKGHGSKGKKSLYLIAVQELKANDLKAKYKQTPPEIKWKQTTKHTMFRDKR